MSTIAVTISQIESLQQNLLTLRRAYTSSKTVANNVKTVVSKVRSYYSESYVRSCCADIDVDLKSVQKYIDAVEREIDKKRLDLVKAASLYRKADQDTKRALGIGGNTASILRGMIGAVITAKASWRDKLKATAKASAIVGKAVATGATGNAKASWTDKLKTAGSVVFNVGTNAVKAAGKAVYNVGRNAVQTTSKIVLAGSKATISAVSKVAVVTGKTAYNVGSKAVQVAGNVASRIQQEIGPGGRFEAAWKAVVTTTKLIGGATLLATSVATGNPLGIVYGANLLINASADLWNINKGDLDKVGKTNVLKTAMKTSGEVIGENLGAGIGYIVGGDEGARTGATIGKSAGSKAGSFLYHAGEIYAVASVGKTVVSGNKTVSELTKIGSYEATKKVIEGVDAVAKDEVVGWVAGQAVSKFTGDYIKKDTDMQKELDVFNEVVEKGGEKVAEELGKATSKK